MNNIQELISSCLTSFPSKQLLILHRASVDSLGCEDGRRQEFVKTAYYNGQKMALKLINIESINLNRSIFSLWVKAFNFVMMPIPNFPIFLGSCFSN